MTKIGLALFAFLWPPTFNYAGNTAKPYTLVYVKDCRGGFKAIYSDWRETTPLPNPLLSDKRGIFTFFSEGDCLRVSTDGGNKWDEIVLSKP